MSSTSSRQKSDEDRTHAPGLTALGGPLLEMVIKFLDPQSQAQLRLVNHQMKAIVDQLITQIRFGDDGNHCGPLNLNHVSKTWPAMKEIHFTFPVRLEGAPLNSRSLGDLALEALTFAGWEAIEKLTFACCGLGPLSGASLAALSQRWMNLRELHLDANRLGPKGLSKMVSGSYPMLDYLNLSKNELGPTSGHALAKLAAACPNLSELDLSKNGIGNDAMRAFVAVEMRFLISVDLSLNKFKSGLGTILAASKWPTLGTLIINLNEDGLSGSVVEGMCKAEWPRLEYLTLSYNNMGLDAMEVLGKGTWPCLKDLTLEGNNIGPEEINVLLNKYRNFGSIEGLHLRSTHCGDAALAMLVQAHANDLFSNLHSLSLGELTGTRTDGIKSLFGRPWLQLEDLRLFAGILGTEGSRSISAAMKQNHFPVLDYLYLTAPLTSTDISIMFENPWRALVTLLLEGCRIGSEGTRAFANAAGRLPKLQRLCLRDKGSHNEDFFKPILQASWSCLESVEFADFPGLPQGEETNWRVARNFDLGTYYCTKLERIR